MRKQHLPEGDPIPIKDRPRGGLQPSPMTSQRRPPPSRRAVIKHRKTAMHDFGVDKKNQVFSSSVTLVVTRRRLFFLQMLFTRFGFMRTAHFKTANRSFATK
jgi:hypothetical protein